MVISVLSSNKYNFMPVLKISKATTTNVPVLVENRIRFAIELSGPQSENSIDVLREQLTNYFTRAMTGGECISFIAYLDDDVAGIGSMMLRQQPGNFKNLSGRWGYIMNMYTSPKFRRLGVCKSILNELVRAGNEIGISAFELHATPDGAAVYSQNGFEIHDEPTYRRFLG